jgi:hypothetical protein
MFAALNTSRMMPDLCCILLYLFVAVFNDFTVLKILKERWTKMPDFAKMREIPAF